MNLPDPETPDRGHAGRADLAFCFACQYPRDSNDEDAIHFWSFVDRIYPQCHLLEFVKRVHHYYLRHLRRGQVWISDAGVRVKRPRWHQGQVYEHFISHGEDLKDCRVKIREDILHSMFTQLSNKCVDPQTGIPSLAIAKQLLDIHKALKR